MDHYPPKGLFVRKNWPAGYVFPACHACNSGSKEAENWIAFFSRINAGEDGVDPADVDALRSIFKHFETRHAAALLDMGKLSRHELRQAARRIGWRPGPGELYRDAPFLRVPEEAHAAVDRFGTKLVKALHFEHTRRIVPSSAAVEVKWFTNLHRLEGAIPDEIFSIPPNEVQPRRGKIDLSEQFNYRFAVSEDGTQGLFTAWFRFSFGLVGFVTFDPTQLAWIKEQAAAQRPQSSP